jgi:A/G-specific adenine glycosylase
MSKKSFQRKVWCHYNQHRRALPWRKTKNPYRILLSELMLQQTQAERVVPKYNVFLKQYPTLTSLKEASYAEVLRLWSGLGYNRRAKYLLDIAKATNGKLPKTYNELLALSGIGPYTAAAIMNFSYEKPTPMIETNIRTAYLHDYFKDKQEVSDRELLDCIEKTMDIENPKEWFNALMDYGQSLKRQIGNQNERSLHYRKQPRFKGSKREVRGAILRVLLQRRKATSAKISALLQQEQKFVKSILDTLEKEGLIKRLQQSYELA